MKIFSVSFGQKFPIASCKVKNNETGKFVPAILYEYDCNDPEDIREIESLSNEWKFKNAILDGMNTKKNVAEKYGLKAPSSFYALKDSKDQIIGISYLFKRTGKVSNDACLTVKFIETKPNKIYKYAGQAMLASHALNALNDRYDKFEIRFPTDEATLFYKDKCGFKDGEDKYTLEMATIEIKKFLRKMFFRTHGRIKDIRR